MWAGFQVDGGPKGEGEWGEQRPQTGRDERTKERGVATEVWCVDLDHAPSYVVRLTRAVEMAMAASKVGRSCRGSSSDAGDAESGCDGHGLRCIHSPGVCTRLGFVSVVGDRSQ